MDAVPPLRLEWRSPAELAENPRNWRRHPDAQIAALSDVIAEVGWAGACLFNERTGRLIDGHARQKVALANGADKVPVLVGSWSEADEAKILATLDPIGAMATADVVALDALLREVQTGSEALGGMLAELAEKAGVIPKGGNEPGGGGDEFDATPKESGPTRTSLGELWLIGGKHRLLVGDCTDAMNVARLMGGETPFLMVTDPPYGVGYDPNWRNEAPGIGPSDSRSLGLVTNDNCSDWSVAYKLFAGPVAYVWHPPGAMQSIFAASLAEAGFEVRMTIIWAKPHFPISRGHYHVQHEPCYYAVRKGCTANWTGDRKQTTLWQIDNATAFRGNRAEGDEATGHSTQKPLECMARSIRNHGGEGDVVYDPFLGSGTTLVAAHRLGRVCYGCELEPRYCDVILKWAEVEGLTVERGD